jgi:hypothetical protein
LKELEAGKQTPASLKQRVRKTLPTLAAAQYESVLKRLVSSGQVHELRKRNKGKLGAVQHYSLEGPPAADFVAPVVAVWIAQQKEANALGVKDQDLIAALLEAFERLGIALRSLTNALVEPSAREAVLRSLRGMVAREGHGALIPIRRLRQLLHLPKGSFDAAVLELYSDDAVILHHHDYVGNLTDTERAELVLDPHGNYYVGIALRGDG